MGKALRRRTWRGKDWAWQTCASAWKGWMGHWRALVRRAEDASKLASRWLLASVTKRRRWWMSEPITVLIVDEHAVVRRGLRAWLEAEGDCMVVGEASSGGEAVLLAADLVPDVVLMDLVMPAMDGGEAARRLKQRSPRPQGTVLTL